MDPLDRVEDERLVLAVRAGDQEAFGRLFDRWYDRVTDLAHRITRDDAVAADVAQDAFLKAWQRLDRLEEPAAFGGWLLRIARNRALDVVRSPAVARTQADEDVSTTADEEATARRLSTLDDPAVVAADREVQALLWSAAAVLGERDLTALDLSLRHGMEPAEIGEVLGINRNAANQLVHRMKARLATAVRCRVLWRGARPSCAELAALLDVEGIGAFDARAVKVADRHAATCPDCTRRRELRLDPAHLFAAVPIAVAPAVFKAEAAAALQAAGVPMGAGPTSAADAGPAREPGPDGTERGGSGRGQGPPSDPRAVGAPSGARSRRGLLLGAGALVLSAVLLGVLVGDLDDGTNGGAAGPTTALSRATVSDPPPAREDRNDVVAPAPAPDRTDAGTEPAPPIADPGSGSPPPVEPPPPPPPPPPAPTGSITVSPSTRPLVVPTGGQAVVSWSSANATTVTISGPGLSSAGTSGSTPVCPGTLVGAVGGGQVCRTPPGTYTYTLTVTGPAGTVSRTATLTVA